MSCNNIDFFVTGGARSGTTYLYNLLSRQESIDMSSVKETNYYLDSLNKFSVTQRVSSRDEYMSLFNGKGLRGEASPFYFFDGKGLRRLKNENQGVKVVLILRNPVDRAYSHYCMDKYKYGFKLGGFLESLELNFEKNLIFGLNNNYRDMSLYFERLIDLGHIFGEENIKVVIFEDLVRDEEKEFSEILDFLGVEFSGGAKNVPKNESVSPRGIAKILIPYVRSTWVRRFFPRYFITLFKSILFKPGSGSRISAVEYEEASKIFEPDVKRLNSIIPGVAEKWGFF